MERLQLHNHSTPAPAARKMQATPTTEQEEGKEEDKAGTGRSGEEGTRGKDPPENNSGGMS